ncbi:hypothetical protein FFZ77_22315 [Streptomyces katsurahamanus]|uniref:Uncharacterized protein n=1 Tax=Streptomyces katsurahamanus TaxID=2577098 RepID=A0ABW9NYV5_9ACTN|nr:hypothetical protein [Streptomyces katsurahamanus]
MADTGPAASVVDCCAFSKTVHNARLDPVGAPGSAGGMRESHPSDRPVHRTPPPSRRAPLRRSPGAPSTPRHPGVEHFKRPSEVIFASTAANTVRARLDASCSLVSLAVQSLRSM